MTKQPRPKARRYKHERKFGVNYCEFIVHERPRTRVFCGARADPYLTAAPTNEVPQPIYRCPRHKPKKEVSWANAIQTGQVEVREEAS